tara:strand:+ start:2679 stop:4163 length:1485 start_codon:yes stop_codon:yes gene_type:complete
MGSNEDTTSTAEDFNSLEVTDPGRPTQTQGTVFGVNGISATGSTERDREIGYSDGRGNPGPNFEAFGGVTNEMGEPIGKVAQTPSQFNAALQATQGGDDSTVVSVPSITAASSNLAPGILGETLSDFQSGVRDDSLAARGMVEGAITPESGPLNMLEAAIASRPRDFSNLDLIPTTGFLPAQVTVSDETGPRTQAAIAATLSQLDQARDRKVGLGDKRGIDFGVTQQLLPTAPPPRPVDRIAAMTMPGTAMGTTPQETGISTVRTDQILADQSRMQQGQIPSTTATGTTGGEDSFDPEAENLMDSTFLDTTPYKEGTAVADIKLRDAPFDENLNLFGLQIPNLAGRALNLASEKLNDRLFDAIVKKGGQALRDSEGRIIGAMDPTNTFLMEGMPGLDSKGQMRGQTQEDQDGGDQPQRRVAPKAPTDPCPDGYQLIDGKCTLVDTDDKGTGFITFPPDRNPPFQSGPFEPKSKATPIVGISGLNPITFNNPFRR